MSETQSTRQERDHEPGHDPRKPGDGPSGRQVGDRKPGHDAHGHDRWQTRTRTLMRAAGPPEDVPPRSQPRSAAVGRYGERVAARYLAECGMAILDRNWRCRDGEIDIVARDGQVLVVCEVKTRRAGGFEHPLEALSATKSARLRVLAERWFAARLPGRASMCEVRIDLVAVVPAARGAAHVEHVRGVC